MPSLYERIRPPRESLVEVTVFGDTQLSRSFLSGAGRLRDLRPAFHELHDFLLEENRRQFDSEGAYASGGWQPLAPSTVAQKQALGLDNGILVRHGKLKAAMTEKGDANAHVKITRKSFSMEIDHPAGEFHQAGTARMPARPPFQLREASRTSAMRIFHRHARGVR
jgi:hypothetical protein